MRVDLASMPVFARRNIANPKDKMHVRGLGRAKTHPSSSNARTFVDGGPRATGDAVDFPVDRNETDD